MNRLIIKGAEYWFNERILIPQYTGEYATVKCYEYVTLKELKNRNYANAWIKKVEEGEYFIQHKGVKYYFAGYKTFAVSNDWELLSDLSNLYYIA